jgi:hypothetical protein
MIDAYWYLTRPFPLLLLAVCRRLPHKSQQPQLHAFAASNLMRTAVTIFRIIAPPLLTAATCQSCLSATAFCSYLFLPKFRMSTAVWLEQLPLSLLRMTEAVSSINRHSRYLPAASAGAPMEDLDALELSLPAVYRCCQYRNSPACSCSAGPTAVVPPLSKSRWLSAAVLPALSLLLLVESCSTGAGSPEGPVCWWAGQCWRDPSHRAPGPDCPPVPGSGAAAPRCISASASELSRAIFQTWAVLAAGEGAGLSPPYSNLYWKSNLAGCNNAVNTKHAIVWSIFTANKSIYKHSALVWFRSG